MNPEGLQFARLTYLLSRYKIPLPANIARHLEGGEWLRHLTTNGPGATGVPLEQLEKLMTLGETMGPGTADEAIQIIQNMVYSNISNNGHNLDTHDKLKLFSRVSAMSASNMNEHFELSLDQPPDTKSEIPKWNSGMLVLDNCLLGLYAAIITVMAPPGVGKTSFLLSLTEQLRKHNVAKRILFFESEIPGELMQYRFGPIFERIQFNEHDKLICGFIRSQDIMDYLRDNPEPDTIVLWDGLDAVALSSQEDGKRFAIERFYQDMIHMKQFTKAVFCTSQPRRNDIQMTLRSGAEAWAKAQSSDIVLGINQQGRTVNGVAPLQIVGLKNRFGPSERAISFNYNYITLEVGDITSDDRIWDAQSDDILEGEPEAAPNHYNQEELNLE